MADSSAVRAAMKASLIGRRIISHQVRARNVDRNQQTGELSLSQLDRKKPPRGKLRRIDSPRQPRNALLSFRYLLGSPLVLHTPAALDFPPPPLQRVDA